MRTIDNGVATPIDTILAPVNVVAGDNFAVDDLVFVDYTQGVTVNLNDTIASSALAAGPAVQNFSTTQASPAVCWGFRLELAGNLGFVIFAASRNASSIWVMVASRYNPAGILQSRASIEGTTPGTAIGSIIGTTLSNGNLAITYVQGATAKYVILSPTLGIIAKGNTADSIIYVVQETNDGGMLTFGSTNVSKISAAGAVSVVAAAAVSGLQGYIGKQTLLNDDMARKFNTRCIGRDYYGPIGISGGGFGYFYSAGTGLSYLQLNADGSLRAGAVSLISFGSQAVSDIQLARDPSTGNIMWAISLTLSTSGGYGVVADNGGIVKGGTALTGIGVAAVKLQLVADASGEFILIGSDGTGAWNILYTSNAGVVKATYPKVLQAGNPRNDFGRLVALTTGTFFLNSLTQAYNVVGTFIPLGGAAAFQAKPIFDFGSGASRANFEVLVFNDTVYGAASGGDGSGNADVALFTMSNAGVVEVAPAYTASPPTQASGDPFWFGLDVNQQTLHLCGRTNGGTGFFSSFRMDKTYIQTYGASAYDPRGKTKFIKGGLFTFCANDTQSGPGAASGIAVHAFKVRATVLLGVASRGAAVGQPMTVRTKGLHRCNFPGVYQPFDQSANSPPGQKGWIDAGIIQLNGF